MLPVPKENFGLLVGTTQTMVSLSSVRSVSEMASSTLKRSTEVKNPGHPQGVYLEGSHSTA